MLIPPCGLSVIEVELFAEFDQPVDQQFGWGKKGW
jgi:hypothetical protein